MKNGFEWEKGFTYRKDEEVVIDGVRILRVNVIPDSKGEVPPLYSQPMLSSFTDHTRPCEVMLDGRCYYSNVHLFKAGSTRTQD